MSLPERQDEFEALFEAQAQEPSWLKAQRQEAQETFRKLGLPNRKVEAFKYSPLKRLSEVPLTRRDAPQAVDSDWLRERLGDHPVAARLVLVQGHPVEALGKASASSEVRLSSLEEALASKDAELEAGFGSVVASDLHSFSAFQAASFRSGSYLEVAAKAQVEDPIELVHVHPQGPATLTATRHLIRVGRHAKATVRETFLGADSTTFHLPTVEILLEPGAQLEWIRDQREGPQTTHFSHVGARLARDSQLRVITLNLGGDIVRNDLRTVLAEENATVELYGVSLEDGTQHVENHTSIDHAVPRCQSKEFYKAILDGKSRGVFRGHVLVRQDAQETDSNQQNQTLLLSERAEMDTKPELEIYADDVKAAHGATIGQLDEKALFFLRARGISPAMARQILVQAFARDLLQRIEHEPLREQLKTELSAAFEARAQSKGA